jgi:hypothetical protein
VAATLIATVAAHQQIAPYSYGLGECAPQRFGGVDGVDREAVLRAMGSGEIAAVFKALAADAARAAGNIAHSVGGIAEKTADIEESNLRSLLDSDSRVADSFKNLGRGSDRGAPAGGWSGARYVQSPTQEAADAYAAIRANAGDVSSIARNTGVDEDVIAQVKNHLFMSEHDIPVGPNRIERGNFTADEYLADLWTKAGKGTLSDAEANEFRSLMSHEYVESRLMESGMPYRSADPASWDEDGDIVFNPKHFGAHEAAPHSTTGSMRHWRALGLTPPEEPIAPDLSNIDSVVDAARRGLGL